MLRVHVRALPAGGAANDALLRLVAAELGIPRSAITLERGQAARLKRVRIDGSSAVALARRWRGLAVS